jgi:hypothetical protein
MPYLQTYKNSNHKFKLSLKTLRKRSSRKSPSTLRILSSLVTIICFVINLPGSVTRGWEGFAGQQKTNVTAAGGRKATKFT